MLLTWLKIMNYRPRRIEIVLTETKQLDELRTRLAAAEQQLQKLRYDHQILTLHYGGSVTRETALRDFIRDNGLKPPI